MRNILIVLLLAILTRPALGHAQEKIDQDMVAKIRSEGLNRSRATETFNRLVSVIGPRLTASPAHKAAVDWTRSRLSEWGLDNVHLEPWEFGRGWALERFSIEMLEPRYLPIVAYPKAWSPSTKGRVVGAPLWLGNPTSDELTKSAGKIAGSIVMMRPIQEDLIREDRPPASGDLRRNVLASSGAQRQRDQELTAMLRKEKPGVTLEPNYGAHGTIFVTGRDGGADGVPSIVLAAEHYNLIARLLEQRVPVKLAVEVQGHFYEQDKNAYNVVAEIRGTDPRIGDEVVMVGAHLDSWHAGTGATDNADGVSVVMESFRILKALGVKPRRTIRMALWGGEEQGLLGSKAYVKQHLAGDANKAARDRFSVYFNLDNGTVPIYGFYLEGNQDMRPIMDAYLKPFNDLGAKVATMQGIGATDHLPFMAVGLPAFQAVHDYRDYDVHTHHTNMDTFERVNPQALKQASAVMASVLYHAAMRDAKMPR